MLKVRGATKYYRNHTGIESVSFDISPGEIVGVFGENGAGKTTLLKAVMGLATLDFGYVEADGEQGPKAVRKFSFITGEGSWFPDLTPDQHGDFYSHLVEGFDRKRYDRLLEYFRLDPSAKAETLSKGQGEKLEAAIGFSRGAKYVIMDEPFMGNDLFTRRDLLKLVAGSLTGDEAVLLATHLPAEVGGIISRAIILKNGRVVEDTAIDDLREQGVSLEDRLKQLYGYDESLIANYLPHG